MACSGVGGSAIAGAGPGFPAVAGAADVSGAADFADAFFVVCLALLSARSVSPYTSLSRRSTGASTVEEALLTNSPMSFRAASTALLGTPNSLASS
jgi:hypothetical protein